MKDDCPPMYADNALLLYNAFAARSLPGSYPEGLLLLCGGVQQAQACTQKVIGGGLLDGGVRQRTLRLQWFGDCSDGARRNARRKRLPTPFQ